MTAGTGHHRDPVPADTDTLDTAGQAAAGPDSFAIWYGEVADGLTRRVGAAIGDGLLGREATAEAFARAYERWDTVSIMASPEGWVYRVAVNVGRRSWRQRGLEARAMAREAGEVLAGQGWAGPVEHHDDVYRAVRRLPRRHRTILRLRYWDDLTEPQIAQRTGLAPGTVSSMLSTARDRLRRALGTPPPPGGTR